MAHPWSRRQFLANTGIAAAAGAVASGAEPQVPLAPPDKQPPNLKVPGPAPKKVGWAVVGLGELALGEVMPAFEQCENSRCVALVSGHPDKAKRVAQHYGIDERKIYNYDDYDRMKDDPAIDVVYNILPNSMHAEYSIRAANAGKHVLCEKPMAVNVEECRQMIEASRKAGKQLMIAYRLRYEPFNQAMIEMARKQAVGKIQVIEASNGQNVRAPNIRLSRQLGGGPLGDVGVYCLQACRYVTGEEPVEFAGTYQQPKDDPRFREVESSIAWTMKFPSGAIAMCSASFSSGQGRRYRVYGSDGWMELDPAFSYRGLRMKVHDGKAEKEVLLREVNHFASEMDHLSRCVLEDEPNWTPGEEGLKDQVAMERIMRAVKGGNVVKAE